MNALTALVLNAACLLPLLLGLDLVTPLLFTSWALFLLVVRRPGRVLWFVPVLGGAAVLGGWVYAMNLVWTVGGHGEARSLALALRAAGLTAISAAFALSTTPSEVVNAAMQRAGLSARWGYALLTALNALPRLLEEQKQIQAVHRVRRGGRGSPVLVQAVTVLVRTIRTAEGSALSMAARGLEKPGPRTWFRPVRWTRLDVVWLVAGLGLIGGTWVVWIAVGGYRFGFY